MTQVDCLEITTVASCTVRCAICPQDVLKGAYRGAPHRLTLDNYMLALSNTPKHVRIHFSGFVEPFLNPNAVDMVRIALAMEYRIAIYTTLVGLTDDSAAELLQYLHTFRSQIDVICLHWPDGINMTVDPEVHPQVFAIACDKANLPTESMKMAGPGFEAIDRAGLVQIGKAPLHHKGPIKCSYTDAYTHNVMLPNGDVHLCCMDYKLLAPLGNLFTQRWDDLDRSAVAKDNACDDGATICRKCHGAVPA